MTIQKPRGEIVFITRLRAISCIAIVILHTFYAAAAYAEGVEKTVALTVRNLMLWAVPCFVMITGALLLDKAKKMGYGKLFGQYILRIVIALVAFCILFEVTDDVAGGSLGIATLGHAIQNIGTGKSWSHMWYLYLILAIYLTLPFTRKIAAHLSKKDAYYLLIVYGAFLSLIPFIEGMTGTKTGFYICVYSVYPFYLFLGYIFVQQYLDRIPRWVWLVLAIAGSVAMGVLSAVGITREWSTFNAQLTSYTFPIIVLQSAGIFGVMYRYTPIVSDKPSLVHRFLRGIDRCSFGIYLIHMFFLKLVLVYCEFDPYAHGGTGMVVLLTICVFVVTYLVVWLLKKIPYVQRIL